MLVHVGFADRCRRGSGTHKIANTLAIGFFSNATYSLTNGTLISGLTYAGRWSGGSGQYLQSGGSATLGDTTGITIPGATVTTTSSATNPADSFQGAFSMKLHLTDTLAGAIETLRPRVRCRQLKSPSEAPVHARLQ